jgi:hypothetical protein
MLDTVRSCANRLHQATSIMAQTDRSKSKPPAWSGAIARARLGPSVARGRGPTGKAVGAFVPGLTRKAFEKFGFSTASLIMDWPRIAGADLAQWTTPERVKWPQGHENAPLSEESAPRPGATLLLRVDPARALDVEYRARQIVERINSYFGYRAIADLRLLQAPLTGSRAVPPSRPAVRQPDAGMTVTGDDPLARALARLEAGVRANSRNA